jgi:hypothetical protein
LPGGIRQYYAPGCRQDCRPGVTPDLEFSDEVQP